VNKKQAIAVAFMFVMFASVFIPLIKLSNQTVSYPVDQQNGGTITPTVDPFSDYDFNETNRPEMQTMWYLSSYEYSYDPTYGYLGTLVSGSISDTYISDDVYMQHESRPFGSYYALFMYLYIEVDLSKIKDISEFELTIEQKVSAVPSPDNELKIYDWANGYWVDLDTSFTSTSETRKTYTCSSNYISDSGEIKLFTNLKHTSSFYFYIDYLCVDFYENGYAEDFSDVGEWTSSYATITTDGDVGTVQGHGLTSDCVFTDVSIDTNIFPFVEIHIVSTNYTWKLRVRDTSGNYYYAFETTTTGTFRANLKELTSGATVDRILIYAVLYCEVKVDWLRIYGFQNYTYDSSSNIDKNSYVRSSDNGMEFGINFNDTGVGERLSMLIDVSNFSTDAYPYFVYSANVSGTAGIKINIDYSTGWTDYDYIVITSNVTNEVFQLDAGKTVYRIRVDLIDDNWGVGTASGWEYGWLKFMTFSCQAINIESITVNLEDTYASPNQTITISSITAKWADGTVIPASNFKVNLIENSSVINFNASAPISREVQLYNSTYSIGVQWCNDTRYDIVFGCLEAITRFG